MKYNITPLSSAEAQGGKSAKRGTRRLSFLVAALTVHSVHTLTPYRSQPIEAGHLSDNRTSAEERDITLLMNVTKSTQANVLRFYTEVMEILKAPRRAFNSFVKIKHWDYRKACVMVVN